MAVQAAAREPVAGTDTGVYVSEQSLLVAALLSMSGGYLDAFTWLSLGGVFASSQTGNVVFLGLYAASGQGQHAAHHLVPIAGFLLGASLAIRIRAPLLCLAGEIVVLAAVMLLLHRIPTAVAILGMSLLPRCSQPASGRSSAGSISPSRSLATCFAPSISSL
ncbi:Protein of unknown function [Bradyrhizobium shewense]|uniref:DUF1275 domain-containing protein n=1 Tax=Bradyrhizobium shewense TaxID=1761772 RepID=A0A1C3U325_9BRAD|nr:YoaK family protein [Bradyrhizobium shewense]SCB09871.1 Protein of unknown function [Bradyrhizobium shewense]